MPENVASEIKFVTNGLPGWVVNGENVHKIRGYSDHYFTENRGFK